MSCLCPVHIVVVEHLLPVGCTERQISEPCLPRDARNESFPLTEQDELATVLIEAGLNTLEHGKRFGKGVGPRKEWPDPTLSNEGIDVARPTAIRVVREPERHTANAVRNAVQADCRALSFNEVDL